MNGYLKQSTAAQARLIGPFLDDTDFKTAETGLTIANTDIKLRANGTTLANKNSGGGTHEVNGMYSVAWDATDTANVGELHFSVVVAGALPVFGTYWVLEEAVYDALFGASAAGYGTAQTGDSFARLGAPAGASVSADVAAVKGVLPAALVSGRIDASVGAIAAGAIDAAAIGTGAIDADAIAADAVGASELAADAIAEIKAAVVEALATDTYAEPGQGAPAATTSLVAKIGYLYKAWRNKSTQTASQYSLYADDTTTVDQKATFADDATTATRGEVATGP